MPTRLSKNLARREEILGMGVVLVFGETSRLWREPACLQVGRPVVQRRGVGAEVLLTNTGFKTPLGTTQRRFTRSTLRRHPVGVLVIVQHGSRPSFVAPDAVNHYLVVVVTKMVAQAGVVAVWLLAEDTGAGLCWPISVA